MKLLPYTGSDAARRFRDGVFPFLLRDEAENSLIIGVVNTLITRPERFPVAYLASILQGKVVVGAVMMTPPYALAVTRMPVPALDLVLEYASPLPDPPSGLIGPKETVQGLFERWRARHGVSALSVMQQRIYRASRVVAPPPREGAMRVVEMRDLQLLERWNQAFLVDCRLSGEMSDIRRDAEAAIKYQTRFLWEVEGRPVSMAGFGGETPSGARVSYVYTPPEERGKGYASALVAALTERLLAAGRRACFLFTDLDNPTSNRVYQRIGYKPVCDFAHYTLARK